MPQLLGLFAYDFLQENLGLKEKSKPSVQEINKILKDNMGDSALLKTFGTLSLKLRCSADLLVSVWS
jgi:hypothetical protein